MSWRQLALGICLLAGIASWFTLDTGSDTGEKIGGVVVDCQGGHLEPRKCSIKIDGRVDPLVINSNNARPGNKVILSLFRRRYSKREFYDLAQEE